VRCHEQQDVASASQSRRAGTMWCGVRCWRAVCGGRTRFTRQRSRSCSVTRVLRSIGTIDLIRFHSAPPDDHSVGPESPLNTSSSWPWTCSYAMDVAVAVAYQTVPFAT
jgi:hypothetical protein